MRMPSDAEANQPVFDIDAEFGKMAVAMGEATWGIEELTLRQKALVCIAADIAIRDFGLPFEMHIRMARANGVSLADVHETILFSAVDGGHSNALDALAVFNNMRGKLGGDRDSAPTPAPDDGRFSYFDAASAETVSTALATMWFKPIANYWRRPGLSLLERAYLSVVYNVMHQVLGAPFAHHVGMARKHGASDASIAALIRFLSEFGFSRAWAAGEAFSQLCDR